jgi:hypothetical protein
MKLSGVSRLTLLGFSVLGWVYAQAQASISTSINQVVSPQNCSPGFTGDAGAAINTALSFVQQGTVDLSCYGYSTQHIATTVVVGPGQSLVGNEQATTWVPSTNTTNMFQIKGGSRIEGIAVGTTSSYTGIVLFANTFIGDGGPTIVRDMYFTGGSAGASSVSGTAIDLIAPNPSAGNGISFARFDHIQIQSFTEPLLLDASSGTSESWFVNGNIFTDIKVKNGVNCVHLKTASATGVVEGNSFVGLSCESGPASIRSIWLDGSTQYTIQQNIFEGVQLWDYGANTFNAGAGSNNNLFFGQMEDSSTNDAGSGNNVFSNDYRHNLTNLNPLKFTYPGGIAIGGHLNQTSVNKFAGTCPMAGATSCTFPLTSPSYSVYICFASPQGGTYGGGQATCSVSGTTVTITAPTANSLDWGALLIGNPN